ncbi:hypothetical protein FHS89_002274 [Rubricella aquisinus]|uniref:Uncharacterized protein n=1 Tax=Rubricella aquisinus TaxID=2028108 RepID=A0A840WME1_9RHOB|nr:hypothetical protein [Rubricella aquisinus]MBB5516248.1 hypothetical protein [Rubricella aquisinus]
MKPLFLAASLACLPVTAFAQSFDILHEGPTWTTTLLGTAGAEVTCSLRNTTGGDKWLSLNANTGVEGDFFILGDPERATEEPKELRLLVQFDEGVRFLRPGFATGDTVMFFLPALETEATLFQAQLFNAETIRIRRLDDNSVVTFRSDAMRPALLTWADCVEQALPR